MLKEIENNTTQSSEKLDIPIKIIGDKNLHTGEVREYHKEIHGTFLHLRPLEVGQDVVIQQY